MSLNDCEWTEAERREVFAEALHHPETAEERSLQQARFRSWLNDPRYRHLWPMLERLIEPISTPAANGSPSPRQSVAS